MRAAQVTTYFSQKISLDKKLYNPGKLSPPPVPAPTHGPFKTAGTKNVGSKNIKAPNISSFHFLLSSGSPYDDKLCYTYNDEDIECWISPQNVTFRSDFKFC